MPSSLPLTSPVHNLVENRVEVVQAEEARIQAASLLFPHPAEDQILMGQAFQEEEEEDHLVEEETHPSVEG